MNISIIFLKKRIKSSYFLQIVNKIKHFKIMYICDSFIQLLHKKFQCRTMRGVFYWERNVGFIIIFLVVSELQTVLELSSKISYIKHFNLEKFTRIKIPELRKIPLLQTVLEFFVFSNCIRVSGIFKILQTVQEFRAKLIYSEKLVV